MNCILFIIVANHGQYVRSSHTFKQNQYLNIHQYNSFDLIDKSGRKELYNSPYIMQLRC